MRFPITPHTTAYHPNHTPQERISAYVEKGAGVDGPTRMAITSALHRVGLSTQAKGKGAAKLVPDMEPGDVAAFFQGHMDVFLSGAAAAGAAAANGAAAAAAGAKRKRGEGAGAGEDGEEEEGSDGEGQGPVSSVERARAAAVEGLAAAVRMPAASDEDRALVSGGLWLTVGWFCCIGRFGCFGPAFQAAFRTLNDVACCTEYSQQ